MTTPANPSPPTAPANPSPANPNPSSPGAGAATPTAPAPGADPSAAKDSAELSALREQMIADRFDAVAARAGIDESYAEVALELFRKTGKEPTKENLATFCTELKKTRPALFGPQPAQTAPTPKVAVPSAPAPGAITTPYQQWQALKAAGRTAEAEAYYQRHHRAIAKTAQ